MKRHTHTQTHIQGQSYIVELPVWLNDHCILLTCPKTVRVWRKKVYKKTEKQKNIEMEMKMKMVEN